MTIWTATTALNQEMHQAKLSHDACMSALRNLTVITQYQFCMTVDREMSADEIVRHVQIMFDELEEETLTPDLLDTIIQSMTFSRDMKLKTQFLHIGERLLQKSR